MRDSTFALPLFQFLTHSLVTQLLKDVSLIGRDVVADAAVKTAQKVRPNEDELSRVDEPAPSDQWVHPDGSTAGAHESVPHTGLQAQKEDLLAKKDNVVDQVQSEGAPVVDRLHSAGAQDVQANQASSSNVPSGDAFAEQAKQEGSRLRDRLSDKIPQEHKDLAKENYNKAKEYAKDKFPEERRNRFIYRLKKVIIENQKHREYQGKNALSTRSDHHRLSASVSIADHKCSHEQRRSNSSSRRLRIIQVSLKMLRLNRRKEQSRQETVMDHTNGLNRSCERYWNDSLIINRCNLSLTRSISCTMIQRKIKN